MVFIYIVFEFIDCHLFYSADKIKDIHYYILEKQQKKWSYMNEKIT